MLLSAPRRSAAIPNDQGTLALYTVSTYSFDSHKKTTEIRAINIGSGQSTLITNQEKTSEPNWLGKGNEVLWLESNDGGTTRFIVGTAENAGKSYVAGVAPGPISDVKLKTLDDNTVAIAFTAKVKPNGTFFNPDAEPKKMSSGKVYDSLMVRHWDAYVTPERNAIWYGVLVRAKPHITESKGRFTISQISNALHESRLESPIPPFGGSDHFDLSSSGIILVAKDPSLDPAFNTKCDFYHISIPDFTQPASSPQIVEIEGLEGAASSPAFSPSGQGAAFLKMKENGYESDKNRVILIPDLSKLSASIELTKSEDGNGLWDRSPSSVSWGSDDETLLLQAEEHGKGLLFTLPVPAAGRNLDQLPKPVTSSGYISDARPLAVDSSHLLISSNSLVDNSLYSILDPSNPAMLRQISSNSRNGSSFSLFPEQVSEIWFKGSEDYEVHAWVIKPSTFDPSKRYPLG